MVIGPQPTRRDGVSCEYAHKHFDPIKVLESDDASPNGLEMAHDKAAQETQDSIVMKDVSNMRDFNAQAHKERYHKQVRGERIQ